MLMLDGVIADDGVMAAVGEEGFVVSSESSRLRSGVEINHCVKSKVMGEIDVGVVAVVVDVVERAERVLGREAVLEEVQSWLRGERSVE